MRRWPAALTCAFLLAVPAGCAKLPQGVDGSLTDDWRPLPAATQFRPASGTCHDKLVETAAAEDYAPLPCDQAHVAETVAVGDLSGAGSTTRAAEGRTEAFRECGKRANALLGGDWRTGWLILQPVLPSEAGWAGGARWYRCDLAETSPVDGALADRTSSMRGALRGAGPLRMSCVDPTIVGEQVTEMHPVACPARHTAEFAGVWSTSFATSDSLTEAAMQKGCDATIATFVGIPDDDTVTNRVGWLGFPPDDTSWAAGDHAVRCFLWLNGEPMTGSYRNAGRAKLKIHYTTR